ncbi:cytochrome c lysine N-methyltransferase ASCRUDRAFT_73479 [Ascoidea rubescens DSM 1968]|uniref:SET domain-containing protein n=1 Tax=Ascoidea rubescens DSM 1968 TaxID=1344418 RepID=A0A1D2VPZ3_9ASCO|nr:hypothetical protein ASCRUDRAFT_73479 [Ascoidea rubescens DSM 1968]ODV63669.1 hypothetical protein ASCRUDRAFT_73479 [Ascoidea rubescens DSM 1968]
MFLDAQIPGLLDSRELSEFISNENIEVNDGLVVKNSPFGGIGLFYRDQSTQNDGGLQKIELLRIPRNSTISLNSFMVVLKKQKKYESDKFDLIGKIISINDGVHQVPIIKESAFMNKILTIEMDSLSELNILKKICIGLSFLFNYRNHMIETTKNNNVLSTDESDAIIKYIEKQPLLKFNTYLKILLNTEISTFDNIINQKYKNEDSLENILTEFKDLYKGYRKIEYNIESIIYERNELYNDIIDAFSDVCVSTTNGKSSVDFKTIISSTFLKQSEFHQIISALKSRSLEIPRSIDSDEMGADNDGSKNEDFKVDILLVPILDFANHNNNKSSFNSYFDVDRKNGDILLYYEKKNKFNLNQELDTKTEPLIEIFISYSPIEDFSEFINNYGFLPINDDNYFDFKLFETSLFSIDGEILSNLFQDDSNKSPVRKLPKEFFQICKWLKFLPNLQFLIKFSKNGFEDIKINRYYIDIFGNDQETINNSKIKNYEFLYFFNDLIKFSYNSDWKATYYEYSGELYQEQWDAIENEEERPNIETIDYILHANESEDDFMMISQVGIGYSSLPSHGNNKNNEDDGDDGDDDDNDDDNDDQIPEGLEKLVDFGEYIDNDEKTFSNFIKFFKDIYSNYRINQLNEFSKKFKKNMKKKNSINILINFEIQLWEGISKRLEKISKIDELFIEYSDEEFNEEWLELRYQPKLPVYSKYSEYLL